MFRDSENSCKKSHRQARVAEAMKSMTMNIDLGQLGEHDAIVQYHDGNLLSIIVAGVDLMPIIADDPYMIEEIMDDIILQKLRGK